jgi:hypothetical protein
MLTLEIVKLPVNAPKLVTLEKVKIKRCTRESQLKSFSTIGLVNSAIRLACLASLLDLYPVRTLKTA